MVKTYRRFSATTLVFLLCGLALADNAHAEIILDPSAQGSYYFVGTGVPTHDPHFYHGPNSEPAIGTGVGVSVPSYYNAFLVFDLSYLPGPIVGLTLSGTIDHFRRGGNADSSNYTDRYLVMSVSRHAVSTPPESLTNPDWRAGFTPKSIYQDLSDGTEYGKFSASNGIFGPVSDIPGFITIPTTFSITLSPDAVADADRREQVSFRSRSASTEGLVLVIPGPPRRTSTPRWGLSRGSLSPSHPPSQRPLPGCRWYTCFSFGVAAEEFAAEEFGDNATEYIRELIWPFLLPIGSQPLSLVGRATTSGGVESPATATVGFPGGHAGSPPRLSLDGRVVREGRRLQW